MAEQDAYVKNTKHIFYLKKITFIICLYLILLNLYRLFAKMSSSISSRKEELERKKAKLQALREEKDRRRREKESKDAEEAAKNALLGGAGDRKQLDEMLSSLGVAPVSDVLSSISSANSLTPDNSINHTPDSSLQPNSLPNK